MQPPIVKADDILINDIIQTLVRDASADETDIDVYNKLCEEIYVDSIDRIIELLRLIDINMDVFKNDFNE